MQTPTLNTTQNNNLVSNPNLSLNNNLPKKPRFEKLKNFVKHHKALSIIIAIVIVILIVLAVIYIWFPVGLMSININAQNSEVIIDGQSYGQIKQKKLILLSPGVHDITVKKDGYLEYSQLFLVENFRKDNLAVTLSKAFYISSLETDGLSSAFLTKSSEGDNLIYFSASTGNFYRIATKDKTYQASNNSTEVLGPNISIGEGETVSFVRYSPDRQKAYLSLTSGSTIKILLIDFVSNGVTTLRENIQDIDWLNEKESVLISNSAIYSADVYGNNQKMIGKLDADAAYVRGFGDGNHFLVIKSLDKGDTIYLNDKSNNQKQIIETGSIVTNLLLSPKQDKYLVTVAESSGNTFLEINNNGELKQLDLPKDVSQVAWLDNENLVFSQFDSQNNIFVLNKKTISSKNAGKIAEFSPDVLGDDIQDMLVVNKVIYFVSSQRIIGSELP